MRESQWGEEFRGRPGVMERQEIPVHRNKRASSRPGGIGPEQTEQEDEERKLVEGSRNTQGGGVMKKG